MLTLLDRWTALNHGAHAPKLLDRLTIEPGSIDDYRALAHLHYRAAEPATIDLVHRATDPQDPWPRPSGLCAAANQPTLLPAAVLVISRPPLNGAWRSLAWPGWLDHLSPRDRALAINHELRTISRVIVRPPYRALGLARRLVARYLAAPLTPRTEALAAMAATSPFFERAGMHRHDLPQPVALRQLRRALRSTGIRPWQLASPIARRQLARSPDTLLALRRWANAGRATRRLLDAPPADLTRAAYLHLCSRPVIYTYTCHCAPASPDAAPSLRHV
ncbi:MAG: hypothetical protein ACREJO_17630 [Phycisphaerales bacterium]